MSDLLEKILWLKDHDDLAWQIGQQSQQLAQSMTQDAEVEKSVPILEAAFGPSVLPNGQQPADTGAQSRPDVSPAPDRSGRTLTTERARALMQRIHGEDIYQGFVPTLAADLQGWNSHHECFHEIIASTRPDTVIDVGVWKGASTIFLAEVLRENEIDGAVIGIDTFLGSPEHTDTNSSLYRLIPRQYGRPLLYEQFLANVVRNNVQGYVVPLPQSTDNAADVLLRCGVMAGLIHLDAAHDYASVLRDARTYWQFLTPGGYLVGDDYHSTWPGVMKAADEFAAEVDQPIEIRYRSGLFENQRDSSSAG